MTMMIPAMLPLYRMNHALFLTATAIVTRRRALPLWHHRLHHLQWVDTAKKAQRSLLRGGTATRTTPSASDMLHRCVYCVFLNYLRHVRLVQNLFTVVCIGFCHATACLICVSLTLYYDVIPMVYIV